MDLSPTNLNISKLKRKMDISALTIRIAGENVYKRGRFYMLWRNGNFIIIQAEPWWRPGLVPDVSFPMSHYAEEHRATWHLQEVLQTMLDSIVIDGENNWAYLVRLKDNTYRLVYKNRQLVPNCPIWTKVVELDDIEMTRFVSGLFWEGVYEGKDIDIIVGWQDEWGQYISFESRGQMLVQSMGIGHYFFDLKAHVAKNGVIIGIMMEAITGRCITQADRSAVYEAIADIQRHGIFFLFTISDIYITERGVRFASASSAKYYRDRDKLAEEAKVMWKLLADIFNDMENNPMRVARSGSRSMGSCSIIFPRLPSPGRPITLTAEEAIIRWIWSIATSDEFCRYQSCAFIEFYKLYPLSGHSTLTTRRRREKWIKGDDRALLPPDDLSGEVGVSVSRTRSTDEPLIVSRLRVARRHPYARPGSKRLLLPHESPLLAPETRDVIES